MTEEREVDVASSGLELEFGCLGTGAISSQTFPSTGVVHAHRKIKNKLLGCKSSVAQNKAVKEARR